MKIGRLKRAARKLISCSRSSYLLRLFLYSLALCGNMIIGFTEEGVQG